jgi:CRP-like cAMP-binding protein
VEQPVRLKTDDAVAAAVSEALMLKDFFPEFNAEHLQKLFPHSGLFQYEPEAVVMRQGDLGRDIFIVYFGGVRVQQAFGSMAAELAALGPGTLLGEMAMLKDGARTATVVASMDSQIFRLDFQDLQYILKNNPPLGDHLRDLAKKRQG